MKLAAFLLMAGAACGGSSPRTSEPADDLDVSQTPFETTPPVEVTAPESAQRLLAAHEQLVSGDDQPDHARLVHALDRLAAALEVVAPHRAEDILRIRQSAAELDRSAPTARTHSALTRTGLEAAADALDSIATFENAENPTLHELRLRVAADAVANVARSIDTDTPLLRQYDLVRVAIREATRGVFAAVGAPEPDVSVYTARR